MVEPTPREQRLARIVKFHAEAAKLLATAEHATMKHHIGLAICDLNEAQAWLNHKDVETNAELLQIADFIIGLGTERLIIVKKLLEMDGPWAAPPIE
jgi:recombinational DNA repair ATPase RecF